MGNNPSKYKALQRAVIEGDVATLEELLTDKAILKHIGKLQPVNCFTKWWTTPLILAAEKGHAECVAKLIEAGANPNCQDEFGNTALHRAVACNHIDCVQFLLGSKIDVNRQTYLTTRTALHMAASSGYGNIVELFTTHTACEIDKQNNSGITPLGVACERGNYSCVDVLLQKGANPQKKAGDCDSKSPLEEAIRVENHDILVLLIEAAFAFVLNDPDVDVRKDVWNGIYCICKELFLIENRDIPCLHSMLAVLIKNNAYLFPNSDISPEEAAHNLSLCRKSIIEVVQATEIVCVTASYGHSLFYNFALSHADSNSVYSLLLFRTLVASGHSWTDAEKRYINANYPIASVSQRSTSSSTVIATLQHLCRLQIRKLLGYYVSSRVGKLMIPNRLKEYILLRDVEYSKEDFLLPSLHMEVS